MTVNIHRNFERPRRIGNGLLRRLVALFLFVCFGAGASAATLQELIDATPEGGTLNLPVGQYVVSEDGDVLARITKKINIVGVGTNDVRLGSSSFTDSLVIETSGVSISGVGFQYAGISIIGGSDVVISNCLFSACAGKGSKEFGGGVYAWSSASDVRVYNSVFDRCVVTGEGGATYNVSRLEGCTFRGNKAASGGACSGSASFPCVVTNCTFTDNLADERQGRGGSIYGENQDFLVYGSTFSGGKAVSGGAVCCAAVVSGCEFWNVSAMEGGALYGVSEVRGCNFEYCSVSGALGEAEGGAVMESGVIISDCSFIHCSSGAYGGALADVRTVTNCFFDSCSASFTGGAIRRAYTVSDCVFTNTNARSGGAIDSAHSVINCTFTGCSAEKGGALIWVDDNVRNCTFDNCVATKDGGAIYQSGNVSDCSFAGCRSTYGSGGAVNSAAAVTGCSFVSCLAEKDGGGAVDCSVLSNCVFSTCSTDGFGGAAYEPARVMDCIFTSCSARAGGAVYSADEVADSEFTACTAKEDGGGAHSCTVLSNCVFAACSAENNGGAAYRTSAVVDCTFDGCKASMGGALYTSDARLAVFDSAFTECMATNGPGGAVYYLTGGQSVSNGMTNCTFSACSAEVRGGAVAIDSASPFPVSRCVFSGCSASGAGSKDGGGALYGGETAGSTSADVCLFVNNVADGQGGGAYNVSCRNCTFVSNSAGGATADGRGTGGVGGTGAIDSCIFYISENPLGGTCNYSPTSSPFFDYARGNFHLDPQSDLCGTYTGSVAACSEAISSDARDLENYPLVNEINGVQYFYAGCYAYAPKEAKGMIVNVPGDGISDSNFKSTLREAVTAFNRNPSAFTNEEGRCQIRFDEALFGEDGSACIQLAQSQMTVTNPLARPLVIRPPEGRTLILDGQGKWRAFHVGSGAQLSVSDIVFTDCLACNAGLLPAARSDNGGAIINSGVLGVTNCTFRGCIAGAGTRINPAPPGYGGAILNRGTAVIAQSTFADNSAAHGGAIMNDGGTLAVVTSTFYDNHAVSGGTVSVGFGGAICQRGADADTALVNVTMTGNAADKKGGAVYVMDQTAGRQLHIVDSLILGNSFGSVGDGDLSLVSGAYGELVNTWYGVRTSAGGASGDAWRDTASEGDKTPSEVFADLTADGTAAIPLLADGPLGQATFPLWISTTTPSVWVRHDADWGNVLYASQKTSSSWTPVRSAGSIPPRQLGKLPLLESDQLGVAFTKTFAGATSVKKERTSGPDIPPVRDPLVVYEATEAALKAALVYANANASKAAVDGVVTVSFAPEVEGTVISVSNTLATLTAFTDTKLVIQGPVNLDAGDAEELFSVLCIAAGNTVELRDVTFSNCMSDAGGAIQGSSCNLICTGCRFISCQAEYGGAICLDWQDCTGVFTECVFDGNFADVGRSIYNDGCSLAFYRCLIAPDEIDIRPRCEVEHSAAQIAADESYALSDFFSDASLAVRDVARDNTIYLLSPDAEGQISDATIAQLATMGVRVLRKYATRNADGEIVIQGGGSALQDAIDMAVEDGGANQVIRVEPGEYAPATVPDSLEGLTIYGTDVDACVILGAYDIRNTKACLTSASAGLTVSNLTFEAGVADGNGGGISGAETVYGCVFSRCSAAGNGGGVAGTGTTLVTCSLFIDCVADGDGNAITAATARNCTFVASAGSAAAGETVDAAADLSSCLLVRCTAAGGDACTYAVDDPSADFVADGYDYTLTTSALGKYPASAENLALAQSEHWVSMYGGEMVISLAGADTLPAGAFPGLLPDSELQRLIDTANPGDVIELPGGIYGPATVPAEKTGLVIRPVAGERVIVNGGGATSALTLNSDTVVEGLTITGGSAEVGGGVCGSPNALLRSCLIIGNHAENGGGVAGVTVLNCTFADNTASESGAAAYGANIYASLGAGESQDCAECAVLADWHNAAESDFIDAAKGDYRILEDFHGKYLATNLTYVAQAYGEDWKDFTGRHLVNKVAGEYYHISGACATGVNDEIQRMIDAAESNARISVGDGTYAPFAVPAEKSGLKIIHKGEESYAVVDGRDFWRGALVEGEGTEISGLHFVNGFAGTEGGGVFADAENVTLDYCLFTDCSAPRGGAVSGAAIVKACKFTGNTATQAGGAFFATNRAAVVTGCRFVANAVPEAGFSAGGAAYAANVVFAGCLFVSNSASCAGGVASQGDVEILNCTFVDNVSLSPAFADASAVYVGGATTLGNSVLLRDACSPDVACVGVNCVTNDSPFVDAAGGDYHVRGELWKDFLDLADGNGDRLQRAADQGFISPEGAALTVPVAGKELLYVGCMGLVGGNVLQTMIDNAEAGSTLEVPAGDYMPASVPADKDGLVIRGADGAVIDGKGLFRCLDIQADDVSVNGFVFENGYAEGDGGATAGSATASFCDCVFTNCYAEGNGGAVGTCAEIRDCRFICNRSKADGGAVYHADRITGSSFVGNEAEGRSGAVYDGLRIYGSLLAGNVASNEFGCVLAGGGQDRFSNVVENCTFAWNRPADGQPLGNVLPSDTLLFVNEATAGDFVDPDNGDYHLKPEVMPFNVVASYTWATNMLAQGVNGADGEPLVEIAGGVPVMTKGCYCDWNMTLQERVDAAKMGATIEVTDGVYPPLFIDDDKSMLTIRAADGAQPVIVADGNLRCITDLSLQLTLEGLVVTNGHSVCYPEGRVADNGGGICGIPGNGLTVRGCTVIDCVSGEDGGGIYGADLVTGTKFIGNFAFNGGGAAGVKEIRTSLFAGNTAYGQGGGVYGVLGGDVETLIKSCTFADNSVVGGDAGSGVFGGVNFYGLFWNCSDDATTSVGCASPSATPFVDGEAGDFRVAVSFISSLFVSGSDYMATAAEENWTSPDGDRLVGHVIDGDFMVVGAYGTRLNLRLQEMIDAAEPGDVVRVPADEYAPALVTTDGLAIVGEEGAKVIGFGLFRGFTVRSPDVAISGFVIEDGNVLELEEDGGAIRGDGETTVVSNCTFRNCIAVNGGGTSGMKLVSGCIYDNCRASANGGGSAGDGEVRTSLFVGNFAVEEGGAWYGGDGTDMKSCTVVSNLTTSGKAACAGSGSVVYTVFCGQNGVEGTGNVVTNEAFFAADGALAWIPTAPGATATRIADAGYIAAAKTWAAPGPLPVVLDLDGVSYMNAGAFLGKIVSVPPVADTSSYRVVMVSNATNRYEKLDLALAALAPGASFVVEAIGKSEGVREGDYAALLVAVEKAIGEARDAFGTLLEEVDWYSVSDIDFGLETVLNDSAAPVIASIALADDEEDGKVALITLSNVKPNLIYGLMQADTPNGDFAPVEESWSKADGDGALAEPLKASATDGKRFFKAVVRDR